MTTVNIGENTSDDLGGNSIDNWIDSDDPTANGDSLDANRLWLRDPSTSKKTPLAAFPDMVGNIPASATVSAATLYLWQNFNESAVDRNVDAHKILENWVDLQVTWNVYSTGNSWATAGALSDGNDRVAAVSGTGAWTNAINEYKTLTGATFVQDVQDDIDGTSNHYGWTLQRQDTSFDRMLYHNSSNTDGNRPYLSVTYTAGSVSYSLKYTNGSTGVLAHMRATNGSTGADVSLKATNGGSGIEINTSGV